jgi:hypothetical protein
VKIGSCQQGAKREISGILKNYEFIGKESFICIIVIQLLIFLWLKRIDNNIFPGNVALKFHHI